MQKILIIDDEEDICLLLQKYFLKNGYKTFSETNGQRAIDFLKKNPTDLVICDFKLPDYNGLEILQKIKVINPKIQVIIITGYSDVRIAVEALKKGAFDYVTKPLYPDEILLTVQKALETENKIEGKKITNNKPSGRNTQEYLPGNSEQSLLVQKHIELIAPTDMSVIVLGETGTGKEFVARAIHQKSKRKKQPFIAVDCGALPKDLAGSELFGHVKGAFTGAINDKIGCFELADGGTLFLDEIGNLTYDNQIKLLRVLQERVVKKVGGNKGISIDVRVVVATNENLKKSVDAREFREDIYHRLNEFRIELTPLRERTKDIEYFAMHFLQSANIQLGKEIQRFDRQVIDKFKAYYWHGNLRELANVVKRSVLLCQRNEVDISCLPPEISEPSMLFDTYNETPHDELMPTSLKEVVEHAEKRAIIEVLKRTNNNKTKTAQLLNVDRKTLYNKLSLYNIEI